ncbi:MAG: ABC transporter ATP-binding protein [Gammaproteobacteria bacterium]|nr:ABC transporter ATP-binding protein [Gammaproteobacteria bacterium]MCP5199993.1 ABC transporter ATP-binding protein [Gammaproteobacteria bacterium]
MTTAPTLFGLFQVVLRPERRFYVLMLVYGVAISALGLSVPLSVQVLIGTVVNAALVDQVLVLALVLLVLLVLAGLFMAVQVYLMELFERRFFSRIVSEVTLRLLYARFDHLERINRDSLVNRYFDVMTVQKSLPPLLTGGLATALQSAVGITLTSFYHPLFLAFNVAVLGCAYLVFRLFHGGAARSSLDLSGTKYDTANWLETLARSNALFKSARGIDYALAHTTRVREAYVAQHRRHFHYTFAQIVGFLLLYAGASAALLGIGGWLVIRGQLTIGQLVAAELILAAIFYGLTRIGYYLELYYDLYAALGKLVQLFALPHEHIRASDGIETWSPAVVFAAARMALPGGDFTLDLALEPGRRVLLITRTSTQVKAITDLLHNHARPGAGRVLLGGHDVEDFNAHRLRDEVQVLDAAPLPECTIAEYLGIAAPGLSRAAMRALLDTVGLDLELPSTAQTLDTALTPYGHPLSTAGVTKLRIAHALAARPQVLVLTPQFDALSLEARTRILRYLETETATTVLCFSHRRDLPLFDDYVLCDFHAQAHYADINAAFDAYEHLVAANLAPPAGSAA